MDAKTQECKTRLADWDEKVIRAECCAGLVTVDRLVDDGAGHGDVDKEELVLEEPSFNVVGDGKCLSCGQDPEHTYKHGQGGECEQLCASEETCCAYSRNNYNNCLLWTQCEGLTAGGGHW